MYRLERRVGGHVGRDRLGQLLVADQRHLDAVPVHVGRDPVRFGRVLDLRHETPVDQPFVVLVEEAHGALESRFGGHDVPHVPAMHFGDGQHHGVERRDVAAHDGLQGEDHRGERLDGAGALLRVPGMGALGVQRDLELHAAGHHRLRADGDLSGGVVRVVMRADDGLHVIRRAGFHDLAGAQAHLLGRLEDDLHAACDAVAVIGQPERRAQKPGHVQVMAAAVHHAGVHRAERQAGVLGDRQAVDVGAQRDARSRHLSLDERDDAGLQRRVEHIYAMPAQQTGQIRAGLDLLEAAFGMLMQIMPYADQLVRDPDMFDHDLRSFPARCHAMLPL